MRIRRRKREHPDIGLAIEAQVVTLRQLAADMAESEDITIDEAARRITTALNGPVRSLSVHRHPYGDACGCRNEAHEEDADG